ncbi:MAG: hypothetical protein FJ023_09595 [Chloroflexi bacterium]|nr:hypothetical protein [Chloroflexota bacterium]
MAIQIRPAFRALTSHPLYHLVMNTMTYGFGGVIQRLMGVLLLPIYTRYLSPGDYGITALLGITSVIMGTITMCAITNGMGRYFYYAEKEDTTLDKVVWSPVLLVTAFSLILLTAAALAARQISTLLFGSEQYTYLVILTLATVFISNLSGIGQTIMVFQERAMMVNIINIATVLVGIGSGLFMVAYLHRGVTGAVEAGLITSLIMLVPVLVLSILRFKPAFSLDILKKELLFSLPLVAALLAFLIIDWSGQYFLKAFLPLSEVGLYNIGYNFGLIIMILVNGFSSAWPPYYFRHSQQGEGQSLCNGVLKAYTFIGAACVIVLAAASPLLLRLFTTESFYQAYTVVPWIALAYMLKGPYIIFLIGVQIKNKTTWQLYLELSAAAVTILGNFLLIPVIGREAAALTTLLSYLVMSLGARWMVMRINPIPNLSSRFFFECLLLTLVLTTGATIAARLGWSYMWSSLILLAVFAGIFIPLSLREFKPVLQRAAAYITSPEP